MVPGQRAHRLEGVEEVRETFFMAAGNSRLTNFMTIKRSVSSVCIDLSVSSLKGKGHMCHE